MTPGAPAVCILGVGNVLMSDEGVGVHAVVELEKAFEFPENVRVLDGGTSTNELLGDLENLDHLIVLDAVNAGKEPGAMVHLEGDAVPRAFTTKLSPHQVGISDLLATLTFLGRAPKHVVLFGVQPERLSLDLTLSDTVARRVPELCQQVLGELDRLGVPHPPRASA